MSTDNGNVGSKAGFKWGRMGIGGSGPDVEPTDLASKTVEPAFAKTTPPDIETLGTATTQSEPTATGQMYRRSVSSGGSSAGLAEMKQEIEATRTDLQSLHGMVAKLLDRKPIDQNVFNALHSELKEYKDDFFFQRLKPIVRPLIFLLDSVEQFENELADRQSQGLILDEETAGLTTENLRHFRDQLTEILAVCETFPLRHDSTAFDPAVHRAVENVTVPVPHDNSVQRVVRSGWTLNSHLLRHIEVVRGRSA